MASATKDTSPKWSFSADSENRYLTYGAVLGRMFDAEVSTVAWSGKSVIPGVCDALRARGELEFGSEAARPHGYPLDPKRQALAASSPVKQVPTLLGFSACAVAALARAQDTALPLEYSAATGCPSAEEFVIAVRDRTRDGQLPSRERMPSAVAVAITQQGATWVGHLHFAGAKGPPVERDVSGEQCSAVAEALAIVTALALDAQCADELEPVPPPALPEPPPSSAETSPEAPLAQPIPAPKNERAAPPKAHQRLEPDGASEARLFSHSTPPLNRWRLAASGTLRSGYSPEWGFGGEVALWYREPSGWQARAAFGGSSPGTVERSGTRTMFLWSGGTLDGCREVLWGVAALCASVDLGVTGATGRTSKGIIKTSSAWKTWLAVGPAVRFQFFPASAWQPMLGASWRWPLLHPRFLYTDPEREVYDTADSRGAFSADIGVAWPVE